MTSSPATSFAEPVRGLVVSEYRPEDDAEALALERACPQGRAMRLSFRRDAFHLRAGCYARHALFTARAEGRLVGVAGVAVKEAELCGRPLHASFGFDVRVHPEYRGRGIARRLFERANGWGLARAEIGYSFAAVDNAVMADIAARYGSRAGGYRYLVLPVLPRARPTRSASRVAAEEVHAEVRRRCGPFDFYCDPFREGPLPGYQGSWMLRRGAAVAGCSARSTRGVLSEVIERLPVRARLARAASRFPVLDRLAWPRLPKAGDELRSWYLFDCFASDDAVGRDLLRWVSAEARAREVDWCHLIHGERDGWVRAVRGDVPRMFAPIVRYDLLMLKPDGTPPPRIERLYVDARDV